MSVKTAVTRAADAQLPAFQRRQYALTAHLRAPDQIAVPDGLDDRRVQVYRELLFNNVENFLRSGFPVLHGMTPPAQWQQMARAFFAGHTAHSPLFRDIPGEFLLWLRDGREPGCGPDWPFLYELAHYEWLELIAMIADAEPDWRQISIEPGSRLQLSPLAFPAHYRWPVQRICAEWLPAQEEETALLVYRDHSDQVQFMLLQLQTLPLLEAFRQPASVQEVVDILAGDTGNAEQLLAPVISAVSGLHQRGILLPADA